MFAAVSRIEPEWRRSIRYISVLLHCMFLVWLLQSPRPIFVAPSSVARGEGGTRVVRLYPPPPPLAPEASEFAVWASLSPRKRPGFKRRPKAENVHKLPTSKGPRDISAKESKTNMSGGSRYGSLLEGALTGEDIRPALPIRGSDPQVNPWELHEEGDVIVEITVDEAGNVVDKKILSSMGLAIDRKVLLALETWHFHPATRDGIPIPSRQDVHYHFKPS